jgi:hypothetical protein
MTQRDGLSAISITTTGAAFGMAVWTGDAAAYKVSKRRLRGAFR